MKDYEETLKGADILVLDDIGFGEKPTGFYNDIIFSALEHRLSSHKPTFFISNYSLAELKEGHIKNSGVTPAKRLLRRIEDSINGETGIIAIK
jgi:DNA replication protein DnaC